MHWYDIVWYNSKEIVVCVFVTCRQSIKSESAWPGEKASHVCVFIQSCVMHDNVCNAALHNVNSRVTVSVISQPSYKRVWWRA